MSDKPKLPEVRITVQTSSHESDDEPYLSSGPIIETPDYHVIVPITESIFDAQSGINVRRFLQTAVALAADNDGRVLLLGIETVPSEAALDEIQEYVQSDQSDDCDSDDVTEAIEERRTQMAEIAGEAQELNPELSVRAVVRAVTDVTKGIIDVLDEGSDTAVLLLRGTGLDEGWLLNRSTIDTILADVECDVFVEKMGAQGGENVLYVPNVEEHTVASLADSETETFDTILLPVGTGPHSALATEAARAVALAADASITVLHVVSPEESSGSKADGEELLKFAQYVLGSEVTAETELREAPDASEVIIEEAKAHDFVSIGAPEQKSRLEQLVFDSVQETVSELSEPTVLMSRDSDETMRSLYYRWKRGIESVEDNRDAET